MGNLSTPKSVQKLQTALHAKAKAEAGYRFYALYDKISREDILAHAFAQCRSNKGAPGVDGQDFADIEKYGVERWLGELALALRNETYRPDPIRRVFIPKANGKLRLPRDNQGETSALPRQNCSRIMTVASPELLPRREPGGGPNEADQHGDEGRVACSGKRALQGEQSGRQEDDHRRVCRCDRLSPQARDACTTHRSIGQGGGTTAITAHLRRSRARGADRALGGIGPGLRQAPEGDHPDTDRGDGAPWSSGARRRGAYVSLADERGYDRSSAATTARAVQPTASASRSRLNDPPLDPCAHILGLARSTSWVRGGGSCRAFRSGDTGLVRADAGGHGYRVGLDGARAAGGARADGAGGCAPRGPPSTCRSRCSASTPTTIPCS